MTVCSEQAAILMSKTRSARFVKSFHCHDNGVKADFIGSCYRKEPAHSLLLELPSREVTDERATLQVAAAGTVVNSAAAAADGASDCQPWGRAQTRARRRSPRAGWGRKAATDPEH